MKKSILFFLTFPFCFSLSNAQVISTVAGNGYVAGGYSGNGGQATAAELGNPAGIVLDASGNIYIADYYNNVIRLVTESTGVITTIAGNGYDAETNNGGFSGDGGLATDAELYLPADVALDTLGNIYIPDYKNNRVRMVSKTTGIITTIAGNGVAAYSGDGGQATASELNQPVGIVIDHFGNLYISDPGNECIRKVTASTGTITTIAGNRVGGYSGDGGQATSAELYYPVGLAMDDSNNIFIADYYNNRVRKVILSSGEITTVAGNGFGAITFTGGYSGDGGQATAAELYNPIDIKFDVSGNLFIADQLNHRLRMVVPSTGIINTIAGNGISGYSGNGGPATAAELASPDGVAIDLSGNIYLADGTNNVVQKINSTTGIEQLNISAEINVFPNPSNGKIIIEITGKFDTRYVEIYNSLGKKLCTSPIQSRSSSKIEVDLNNEAAGIYLYRVLSKEGQLIGAGKLIVK